MAFLEVVPALRLGGIWVVFLDDFWAFSGLYFDGLCAVLMAFFYVILGLFLGSIWVLFWRVLGLFARGDLQQCLSGFQVAFSRGFADGFDWKKGGVRWLFCCIFGGIWVAVWGCLVAGEWGNKVEFLLLV